MSRELDPVPIGEPTTGPVDEVTGKPADGQGEQPVRGFSRRRLLKAVGIGGGIVVVAGATGVGVRGATNGAWNRGAGAPYELWSTWQDVPGLPGVVAAAALAASPHNIQPWRFAVSGGAAGTVDLFADPSRAMPVNDADGRERAAGYGCAIENMVIAARSRGLDATVTTLPSSADAASAGRGASAGADAASAEGIASVGPAHVARVELRPGLPATAREQALAAAISARHSNRGPYTGEPLDAGLLAALAEGALGGAEVLWVADAPRVQQLGALYVEATQAIVDDEEMSVEGFSWFRNDRADIDAHRDGLTLDCQGLDPFTLFMAKILPAQSRSGGDAFWVEATREVHTATAAAYGVIRVPDVSDPAARLAGGRLLQRIHLAATDRGLGLQHMNQITERIARDAALGNPDRFASRWSQVIGIPAAEGLVSFRIGHPERDPNPSPRRPLDAVLAV